MTHLMKPFLLSIYSLEIDSPSPTKKHGSGSWFDQAAKNGRKITDQRSTATAEQELKLKASSQKHITQEKEKLVASFFFVVGDPDWILEHKTRWDRPSYTDKNPGLQRTKLRESSSLNWWGWRGCVTEPREHVGRFLVTDHHLAWMM